MSTRVLTAKFGKSKANLPATESWQRSDCTTSSLGWSSSFLCWFSKHKNNVLGLVPALAWLGLGLCLPLSWQPLRVPWGAQWGTEAAGSSGELEQPCRAVSFWSVAFLD